eukprot:TRINITY_DN1068_c0_g1_i2.p1 TRINITY_DN1068_c0_g1~~TRINITY_DN1068_c0_g1_i2.p1  ORF type:complete len:285 (-),score=108.81 TRINITY_DN1068_c0_g1_i2:91-945(-)
MKGPNPKWENALTLEIIPKRRRLELWFSKKNNEFIGRAGLNLEDLPLNPKLPATDSWFTLNSRPLEASANISTSPQIRLEIKWLDDDDLSLRSARGESHIPVDALSKNLMATRRSQTKDDYTPLKGWLKKKGPRGLKAWKLRYFEQKGKDWNLLVYYDKTKIFGEIMIDVDSTIERGKAKGTWVLKNKGEREYVLKIVDESKPSVIDYWVDGLKSWQSWVRYIREGDVEEEIEEEECGIDEVGEERKEPKDQEEEEKEDKGNEEVKKEEEKDEESNEPNTEEGE